MVLDKDVLQDVLAMSIARAITAANRAAKDAGVEVASSQIEVAALIEDGRPIWRVSYIPEGPALQRGGDLVVDVATADASVQRVLMGQ